LTIWALSLSFKAKEELAMHGDFEELIEEARQLRDEQIAAAAPWIMLFQIVVTFGIFVWAAVTTESHKWYEYVAYFAIAYGIALILTRVFAYQIGKFLGKRAAHRIERIILFRQRRR